MQLPKTDSELQTKINKNAYDSIKQIKINFKFLHIFIKEADKICYIVNPQTKLFQIKKRLDELTKKNFIFFLRQSFIPSLNSRVGDIGICYGRKQGQDTYQLVLTASQNPHEYG